MPLITETNTPAVERRILRAAREKLGRPVGALLADFEHGQWWITDHETGAIWSVVDCRGPGGDYVDFEEVSHGEER